MNLSGPTLLHMQPWFYFNPLHIEFKNDFEFELDPVAETFSLEFSVTRHEDICFQSHLYRKCFDIFGIQPSFINIFKSYIPWNFDDILMRAVFRKSVQLSSIYSIFF